MKQSWYFILNDSTSPRRFLRPTIRRYIYYTFAFVSLSLTPYTTTIRLTPRSQTHTCRYSVWTFAKNRKLSRPTRLVLAIDPRSTGQTWRIICKTCFLTSMHPTAHAIRSPSLHLNPTRLFRQKSQILF